MNEQKCISTYMVLEDILNRGSKTVSIYNRDRVYDWKMTWLREINKS